jgi:salicylate hydroxylase
LPLPFFSKMISADTKAIDIAVIGGGFGGLAVAIGLQKYPHINVQVYEGAEKFAEIGAGVHLGPNSQRAMELIDPRIKAGYEKRAAYAVGEFREDGEFPWMSIYKGQPPNSNERVVAFYHPGRGSSIHRAHFLDELAQLIQPERAHFGKRLDHIYESNDAESPIVLQFTDGSMSTCDILIGADGVHSVTRSHILPPNDPAAKATFTGGVIYRAVVPIKEAIAKLGDIKQESGLRCGKDAIVVGFPIANGTLYNLAVTMFNLPPWEHKEWIIPADVSAVKKQFDDWDPFVRKQVELLPEGGKTVAWSVWDMPPAPYYSRGRIAIMGDAAHASTPYQGAGAGQAIEDAMVLSYLLGKCLDPAKVCTYKYPQKPQRIIPLALQAYDAVRRFRSQKVVVTSREMGNIISGAEPNTGLDIEKMRQRLDGREDWIWRDDTWKQVEDGLLMFEALRAAGER